MKIASASIASLERIKAKEWKNDHKVATNLPRAAGLYHSGVYICQLVVNGKMVDSRKLTLVK
jgi:hypothetical protein